MNLLVLTALKAVAEASIRKAQEEGHIFSGAQQYQFRQDENCEGQIFFSLWVRLWGGDSEFIDSWSEEELRAALEGTGGE